MRPILGLVLIFLALPLAWLGGGIILTAIAAKDTHLGVTGLYVWGAAAGLGVVGWIITRSARAQAARKPVTAQIRFTEENQ